MVGFFNGNLSITTKFEKWVLTWKYGKFYIKGGGKIRVHFEKNFKKKSFLGIKNSEKHFFLNFFSKYLSRLYVGSIFCAQSIRTKAFLSLNPSISSIRWRSLRDALSWCLLNSSIWVIAAFISWFSFSLFFNTKVWKNWI